MGVGIGFDAVLDGLLSEDEPGAAVAVLCGDEIHRRAFGIADMEWGVSPLGPTQCFVRRAPPEVS